MEQEPFLSITEFAYKMHLHPNTVRRCIKKGRIQSVRIGSGKRYIYRIPYSEINRLALFDLREVLKNIAKDEVSKNFSDMLKATIEESKNHND